MMKLYIVRAFLSSPGRRPKKGNAPHCCRGTPTAFCLKLRLAFSNVQRPAERARKPSWREQTMIETVVKVDGMMCGMCESHVNDAVRKAFPEAKKVASSHTKGQTVIHSEQALDEAKLRDVINATGYEVKGVSSAPYEKKGFFSFLRK
jgi:copper chaperone CopZ